MEPQNKRGRPKGTTEYDMPKINKHHFLTPIAHEWVRANKRNIEWLARMEPNTRAQAAKPQRPSLREAVDP